MLLHSILCATFTISFAKALKHAADNYVFKISNAAQMADITQPTTSARSGNDTVKHAEICFELSLHLRWRPLCRKRCTMCARNGVHHWCFHTDHRLWPNMTLQIFKVCCVFLFYPPFCEKSAILPLPKCSKGKARRCERVTIASTASEYPLADFCLLG